MTRINTNVESLRGLRNIQKANSQLQTSLQRLSTGLKINSGKDNPAGLIASEGLRLQITTIEQSIKNSNRANNVIATADSALGEIGGLLNQVRGLIQEGINVGALSADETEANQAQIDAALSAINRISANTTFAGDKLLDGSKAFTTALTTTDLGKLSDYRINEAIFGSQSSIEVNATVDTVAEKAQIRYTGGALSSAATVEIGGAKGSQTLFLGGTSTVANIRDAINNVSDSTGVSARVINGLQLTAAPNDTVTVNPNGNNNNLVFTDLRSEPTGTLTIAFNDPGANNALLGVTTVTDDDGNTTLTVNLATDANGTVTSTADQVKAAIAADATANATVSVVDATGNDGSGVIDPNQVDAAVTIDPNGANNSLVFTDARATPTGTISINYVDPNANSQALGLAVAVDGNGNSTITVNLATDANGNITTTGDQLKAAIAANGTTNALVTVADASGNDGSGVIDPNAVAGTLTTALAGANNDIIFTDARANPLGDITITYVDPGANSAALGISVTGTAITVNLATDANGAITTTADDLKAAIAGNANSNALVSTTDAGGNDGSGVVTALASQTVNTGYVAALTQPNTLTGYVAPLADAVITPTDRPSIQFTDARAAGATGSISIAFVDPGANSAALSIANSTDANGNRTISVVLGTDANGNITSTLDDIATAIAADSTASTLVTSEVTGSGVAEATSSTALGVTDGTIVLESDSFGSTEFVNVNVLNGSFLTYGEDGTTYSTRDSGTDIAVTINGQTAQGKGLQASIKTASLDASLSFEEASNVANTSAVVTITGGGSLFQIGQEATSAGQIGIGIEAVSTARLGGISGKLYELGSGGGKSLVDVRNSLLGSSGDKVAQSDLVEIVEQALNRVSTLRGRLGAIQKNVIETNISTLGVALENISEARSQILDTDFAEETANLQKAQILNQAGISVLSIANQNPQQVLSLLR